ncbi:MAG: DUF488 family protein [Longimicrobiales bacterium]
MGHSTRGPDEFLALLRAHGIRRLVDVRRFPGSRRYPHFSQRALAAALDAAGIAYVHEEALGGRRSARKDSPNTGWRNLSFRGYADHMATSEFLAALDRLAAYAESQQVAILCAEAVPWQCHRNLIADALVTRGIEVVHILSEDRTQSHTLNPLARERPDGSLVYPAAQ